MKIYAIGGYSEVGKNMTLVELGEDAIIFDCGLYLPPIVELENKRGGYEEYELRAIDALPNDLSFKKLWNKVKAILVGHAHLDHVGAIPYVGYHYKEASVVGTPFTIEVLKSLLKDNPNIKFKNRLVSVMPNSSYIVKGKKEYKVEFINITHSTLQTALMALHTDEGIVLYANDFKFDNTPVLGKKPNYKRLKEIAKEGVKALIIESLYAEREAKTPSEKIARGLLEDVLLTTINENSCIVVTTFSSHIARLKSIVDCGKLLGRKIVFLGRSLHRYVSAAAKLQLAPFIKDIKLLSFRKQLEKQLRKISKKRERYMIVCTGHQGEPGSVLERLSYNRLPFKFKPKDHVVFSSSVIPNPANIANRKQLEKKLKEKGVRIFTDVHVSGHCSREDLRDMIEMVKPEHIIPAHGDLQKLTALAELASELGYKLGKNLHLLQDGQFLALG